MTDLQGTDKSSIVKNRDNASDCQTRRALFDPPYRQTGFHHFQNHVPKLGQVVSESAGIVKSQERGRGRDMEMKLLNRKSHLELDIGVNEQVQQTVPVSFR